MTLLQSWADSLTLLKPKNFQLFVMVTIKSILEAYKLYVKYFWWAILLLVMCAIAPCFAQLQDYVFLNVQYKNFIYFTSCWLYELLFLAACFSTRPSILQKDCAYFRTQFKKIILFWMFVSLFSWSSAAYFVDIFTVLFFADSDGGLRCFLRSLWNAVKMVVFNLPLILLLGAAIYFSAWIGGKGLARILVTQNISLYPQFFLFFNVIGALLLPIGVCTYTNIYIKKLHDQFDLYNKQPK